MFRSMVARLGHRRWFAALGGRTLHHVDRGWHRLTGRTVTAAAFPTLLLHCGGRPVPLLHAPGASGALLVAATNWGRPEHPAWSERLLAGHPAAVQHHRETPVPVAVHLLTPEEVVVAWPALVAVWPAFDTYSRRSHRGIRVFRLTPADAVGEGGTMGSE